MGQNGRAISNQFGAMPSHRLICGDIFRLHLLGFFDQSVAYIVECPTFASEPGVKIADSPDRPKKIDRRRASRTDHFTDVAEGLVEFVLILGLCVTRAERYAHCGS